MSPQSPTGRPDPGFDSVMLGGGLGIYALTRAMHEAYGVVTTVVTPSAPEPMRRSITCSVHEVPRDLDDTARVAALVDLARTRPAGRPAVLLCNRDGDVEFIARNAEALSEHYALRFPSVPAIETLADKASFAQLCERLDVPTPRTEVLDFRDGSLPATADLPFPFPVVAKPAMSQPHVAVRMPGKKKVYFVESAAELASLAERLHAAGFRDRFVVQELIGGDDTAMRSITAYRDASGTVTLLAGAQVLLEEHTPDALGRPAAMITRSFPEEFDQARRVLETTDYVGFANFDIKVDPRDGSSRFLEVNPRIGRNSYYVTGGGANVARFLVEDAIFGRSVEPVVGVEEILYSIVPTPLLLRYITDGDQKRWVRSVARRRTVNPWSSRAEGPWLRTYAQVAKTNQVRKFLKHYPRPTSTGF